MRLNEEKNRPNAGGSHDGDGVDSVRRTCGICAGEPSGLWEEIVKTLLICVLLIGCAKKPAPNTPPIELPKQVTKTETYTYQGCRDSYERWEAAPSPQDGLFIDLQHHLICLSKDFADQLRRSK